jgi:hypothetical protein
MRTEKDLREDGWGFQRGNGFVYYETPSEFRSIQAFCRGEKELGLYVDELIAEGEHVVFTHYADDVWKESYFSEFYWMQKKGHLILLSYGKDASFFGEHPERYQESLDSIDKIFEVAAKETNINREKYNRILDQTYFVTDFKFHSAPITFTSNHFAKGWTVFLQTTGTEEGSRYSLFAANRERKIFKSLPFDRGTIERVTEHGTVMMAKSEIEKMNEEPCLAHITFTVTPQTEKTKLSMLTKENVSLEETFCPIPFKKEPSVR